MRKCPVLCSNESKHQSLSAMYELENIKTEIIDAVTLAYPNSEDTFMLDKDASDHCIGAESSQRKRKRKRSDLVL